MSIWTDVLDAVTGDSNGTITKTVISPFGYKSDGVTKDSMASRAQSCKGNLSKSDSESRLMHKAMAGSGSDSTGLQIAATGIAVAGVGAVGYGLYKGYQYLTSEDSSASKNSNQKSDNKTKNNSSRKHF